MATVVRPAPTRHDEAVASSSRPSTTYCDDVAEVVFPALDVGRIRFAISPLWETVASIRTAQTVRLGSFHHRWAAGALTSAVDGSTAVLRALVPATGHLADFLTPLPPRRHMSFEDELASVDSASEADVIADLDHLIQGQPDSDTRRILERGRADVDGLRRRVGEELHGHWTRSIEPWWQRLRAVAEADVSWRLEQMADAGPRRVLETLHSRVRLEQHSLAVDTSCPTSEAAEWGQGMVLVPCVFAWPEVLCLTTPGRTPTLSYAPRGVGRLWEGATVPGRGLAELVGRTRAGAVAQLDLPMTTIQLATSLAIAAPTMNAHLQILRRAGVVTAKRRGRQVFYSRTQMGDQLAAVEGPMD